MVEEFLKAASNRGLKIWLKLKSNFPIVFLIWPK
jgi:hypothetical protein